jgi:hypothetical protein
MSAATAKVIDFQAYRSARLAEQRPASNGVAMPVMPMFAPMAWLPLWFVPMYFVGAANPAE